MTSYVFDQAWQRELDRLHGLENTFDASTTQRLTQLGVRDGWRCLRLPRRQESLGDGQLLLEATVTLGAARMLRGDADGAAMLRHALGDARTHELEDVAARATLYLAWLPLLQRSYEGVARHLEEGLRYADDHELSYWRQLLASARSATGSTRGAGGRRRTRLQGSWRTSGRTGSRSCRC